MFVNVPIGATVAVLAQLVVPETARVRGRFDLTGALTSTVAMTALVYGFVRAATAGWADAATIVAFVLGGVLMVAFVITERRAQAPITPLRLFADRNRATSYLARLMMVAGMMGMFFFLTQFLQNILGYSPIQTGFAFLPITVVLFVSSQVTARYLIERFPAKALMVVGISMSAAGLVWLTQLSAGSSYAWLVGALLMFGTGNGLGFMPLTAAALAGVRDEDSGAASGLVNTTQQVGGSLGLAVLVTVFGATTRNVLAHPPHGLSGRALAEHAFAVGADRAFAVSSGFVIATLLLVIFAIRSLPKPGHPTREQQLVEDLETTGSISATASG
jgi:predicted MFS family arabinose efflux permease